MMRRKSIFTILAAVFMVLAFSAMAFAANQVFLKTTVPNIPKSTCWQAGTDTMEFDNLSNVAEGDVIEFTLNNNVTICKAINMFLTFGPEAGTPLDTTGDLPASTTGGTITAARAGNQWGVLIQAPVGQQIIRLTVRQRATASGLLDTIVTTNVMTFTGTTATDKFVVKLFDGKIGTAVSGFWKQATPPVALDYDVPIVASDNSLCINTLTPVEYMGEYVQNTPNSIPIATTQKLNFSGDYTIAHIMTAATLNLLTCKDAQCGNIVLGAGGQGATCTSFDYETIGNGTNGYCSTHKAFTPGYVPKFIIQSSQAFESSANYTVKAEILVNGNLGEHGVYWSSTAPTYAISNATLCGTTPGALGFSGVTYLRGDGVTTVTTPQASGSNNCAAVTAGEKAVSFTTGAQALFTAGQFFFELNLPDFVYNLAEVNANDVVTVRVTLSKATCGTWSFDLCMGTFIGTCPTGTSSGSSVLCPFVTSLAAGDTYWNGLALTNTSSSAATVTLTANKADGTTATASVAVPAKGVVSQFVSSLSWTGTKPAGVPAYISASSTVEGLNGFVMMADDTSNSMGYLCTQPK